MSLFGYNPLFIFIAGAVAALAVPAPDTAFIGRGTDKLTVAMLQIYEKNSSNYVFSPLGYSTLLAVLAEGGVGPTKDQIASFLQLPEDVYATRTSYRALLAPMQEKGEDKPEFKNWFYTKKNITIDDGFRMTLSEHYFTDVKEIDNSLSSPQTNDTSEEAETTTVKITPSNERMEGAKAVEEEIVQSLADNRIEDITEVEGEEKKELHSKAILFNALFFDGKWKDSFKKVSNCSFQTESGPVSTDCIESTGDFEAAKLSHLKAEALLLPYQGGRYSLIVILPEKDQTLEGVISKFTPQDLSSIDKELMNRTMKICLPKFKFYTITRPKQALNKEGIEDVYSETLADLSAMTGSKQLYLADLVQFTTMEIHHKSASYNYLTATSIASLRQAIPEFNVNRPFLFFLRDRIENYTVVAGKFENPNSEN